MVAIMIGTGILGGLAAVLWQPEPLTGRLVAKHLALAVLAALTVPLFLRTISSNLAANGTATSPKDLLDYLVFGGFCLLASYSAPAYVQRLTERILRELEQGKKEIKLLKDQVEPILDKETEDE
ncbi:MAG: YEATS-associated helix-containing protein [Fimbriimonas sp.]